MTRFQRRHRWRKAQVLCPAAGRVEFAAVWSPCPWQIGYPAETELKGVGLAASVLCRGVAKLVKASDFDSDMRGFESFLPCQIFSAVPGAVAAVKGTPRAQQHRAVH